MSDKKVDGVPVDTSGATSGAPDEKKSETYDKTFVEKLLTEKKNYQSKVSELENQLKAKAETELKEKEQWKTLFETKSKEVEDLTTRLSQIEQHKVQIAKESELKKELQKLGIKSNYLEKAVKIADLNSIKADGETGTIYGADVVAKSIAQDWSDLFGGSSAGVDHSATKTPPTGNLTFDEWSKLPYDERKKREGEMLKTMGAPLKK
jgi:hypothetical protein